MASEDEVQTRSVSESSCCRRAFNPWWLVVVVCVGLAGSCVVAAVLLHLYQNYNEPVYKYAVGMDAGSSHTQLYVYRWLASKNNGTGIVTEVMSCPANGEKIPAISSFVDSPQEAGASLKPCLNRALWHLQSLKGANISETPILLGATAGMRLLRLRNASSADAIMQSVRETIRSYPFNVSDVNKQVRIISGSEEGAFAWISVNFLNGTFGFRVRSGLTPVVDFITEIFTTRKKRSLPPNTWPSLGALDLGGASTQVAFEPEPYEFEKDTDSFRSLDLYGYNYKVFTQSYLCYGMNEAIRRHRATLIKNQGYRTTIYDPCAPVQNTTFHDSDDLFVAPCTSDLAPSDYDNKLIKTYRFEGTSNPAECQSHTQRLFNFSAPCPHPPCSFNGKHQPPIKGGFLAFSGFYYTARFLNLTEGPGIRSLEVYVAMKDSYCRWNWDQVKEMPLHPGDDSSNLITACFQANYVQTLLVDGYKFKSDTWKDISFNKKFYGSDLGWIVGMLVSVTNLIPADPESNVHIDLLIFISLLALSSLFILISFGFAAYAFTVSSRRRSSYRQVPASPFGTTPVSNPSSPGYGTVHVKQPMLNG